MLGLLISVAVAAPPPIDLEDSAPWEKAARVMREGPAGCWQFEGRMSMEVALHTPASAWSRGGSHRSRLSGDFTGTLDEGRWVAFERQLDPADSNDWLRLSGEGSQLTPLVGIYAVETAPQINQIRIDMSDDQATAQVAAASSQAVNRVDRLMDTLTEEAELAYIEWVPSRDGLLLHQFAELQNARGEIELLTFFPGGGAPSELTVTLPPKTVIREGPLKLVLMRPQLHFRGQAVADTVLPVAEAASLVISFFGITVGIDQRIDYQRAWRCAASPEPSSAPP